jgi:hypothetical protein
MTKLYLVRHGQTARIQQDTACTNPFTHKNGQWLVTFLNDTSYLKALKKPALKDS